MKEKRMISGVVAAALIAVIILAVINTRTNKAESAPLTSSLLCVAPIAIGAGAFSFALLYGSYALVRWGNAALGEREAQTQSCIAQAERLRALADAERAKAQAGIEFGVTRDGRSVPMLVNGVLLNPSLATSPATLAGDNTAVVPADDSQMLRAVGTIAQGGEAAGRFLTQTAPAYSLQRPMEERVPHTVRVMDDRESKLLPPSSK